MNGMHIANFMSAASKAKCKLPGRYISKIATAIRSSKVKMTMIEMSMLLHSLRMYKHGDEFIMDLIKAITELFKAYNGKITGRVVGNMVLGLKGMSSDREEVLSWIPCVETGC